MSKEYILYHIPGRKIGCTTDLYNRVTEQQGYEPGEYEVLEKSNDIDYISKRELQLQKEYGYRVDRVPYNKLNNNNNFKDDGSYNPNFEYDRLGRPVNDPNEALNVSKDIMEKRNPGYESTKINPGETTNVFGSLTTSVVSGKNKGDRYADYTEEQHADMLEKATKWFKSREKQFGVGNVDRGNMANSRFYDYLANYGGPESAGGSWLQQRMIDSAYGRVDNEPHIPKDKRMYEEGEWTADKELYKKIFVTNI
jgi:hypothetical protein